MTDKELLSEIAEQLYKWSHESRNGGWSTHQCEPMEKLASQINKHLSVNDSIKVPDWIKEHNRNQ